MNNFKMMLYCDGCGAVMMVSLDDFHQAMQQYVSVKVTCDTCGRTSTLNPPTPPPVVPTVKYVAL